VSPRAPFSSANRIFRAEQGRRAPHITIREKILSILDSLRRIGQTTFRALLHAPTDRIELIVTFIAMLELVKGKWSATQSNLFGDIQIRPTADLTDAETEVETEFID
jgi:segregation and condensation protein A